MNSISTISHENIARRAYQIWEEAGRREGNEEIHWAQAERELRAHHETTGDEGIERARSVEPPITGHHPSEHARHSSDYSHPGVTTDSLHHVRDR
jgi:hypothetical protein